MSDTRERRRSPRVEVIGKVQGRVASSDMPIVVREMALGGMSIESASALEVGSVINFLLTLGDGAGIEIHGRTVYTRAIEGSETPRFISGIQFIDENEAKRAPVRGIVSKLF